MSSPEQKSQHVRAEGITEEVGTIELKCQELGITGFGSSPDAGITVELNTNITNHCCDDRGVRASGYHVGR